MNERGKDGEREDRETKKREIRVMRGSERNSDEEMSEGDEERGKMSKRERGDEREKKMKREK